MVEAFSSVDIDREEFSNKLSEAAADIRDGAPIHECGFRFSSESEDTVRQTLYVKFTPAKKNISVSLQIMDVTPKQEFFAIYALICLLFIVIAV